MQYISRARRADVDTWRKSGFPGQVGPTILAPENCGELNYALTMTVIEHPGAGFGDIVETIMRAYLAQKELRYQRINDLAGAVECSVSELDDRCPRQFGFAKVMMKTIFRKLYKEIARPYEDSKIKENGDLPYPR